MEIGSNTNQCQQFVDKHVLDAAITELADLASTFTGGVCKGKVLDLQGKQLCDGHQYCHSWLTDAYTFVSKNHRRPDFSNFSNFEYKEGASNFIVLNCVSGERSNKVCSAESRKFLVNWMAKESPFSKYILNKHDQKSLDNSGVIILCGPDGADPGEALWICKVLRFCTEGEKAAEVFQALCEGGVDPLVAVLAASYVRTVLPGAVFGYTGIHSHSTVFKHAYIDVGSLVKGEPLKQAENTSEVFQGNTSSSGKTIYCPQVFKEFCKSFVKSDGWGGSIETDGAKKEDFIAKVLDWQKEFVKPSNLPPPPPAKDTVYLDFDV